MRTLTFGVFLVLATHVLPLQAGNDYFLNDASTNQDMYCSAIGSDSNDGLTPATPKLTLANVLSTFDLESGDTVYIDTGNYPGTAVTITSTDSGASTGDVFFIGSTNISAGGSVFTNSSTSANIIYLSSARYLTFRNIITAGGRYGFRTYNTRYFAVEDSQFNLASSSGITLNNVTRDGTFHNCMFAYNDEYSVEVKFSCTNLYFDHCVGWSPNGLWIYAFSYISVSNSIFLAEGEEGSLFRRDGGAIASDYNVYYLSSNAWVDTVIPYLADYREDNDSDQHSVVADPLFANPESMDFHLKSVMGRWQAGLYATDTVHSVAIDLGNPDFPFGNEPPPNGERVNVGLFGNTGEASKSRTSKWVNVLSYNAGGTASGTVDVYWISGNMDTSDKATVEYSLDGGETWGVIVTNIPITNGMTSWNTTLHGSSAQGLWRVVCETETNAMDFSDTMFSVHNTNLFFYVNDTSLVNDVYSTVIGATTNSGTSSNAPKSSLRGILDDYVLNPGDIIYIDTGIYTISNTIAWDRRDNGESGQPLQVCGSTNGSEFVMKVSSEDVFYFDNVDGVRLADIGIVGGDHGVNLYYCDGFELDRVVVRQTGAESVLLTSSDNVDLMGCVVWDSDQYALNAEVSSTNATVENCVLWSDAGISVEGNSWVTVLNSAMRADGGGNYIYSEVSGGILSDYNVYYVTNDAYIANGFETLVEFQKANDRDWHSTVIDPLFADHANGDFHLQSVEGRWNGSTYVTDAEHSPAIDLGNPASAWTNEPIPNGSNVNVGAFGNYGIASMSRTNAWLQTLTYNDGGLLNAGYDTVYWTGGNIADGETVMIQLSRDSGVSWITIATNIPVHTNEFLWTETNQASSVYGRWRVVLESDTNIVDSIDEDCLYRNGPFVYYVNDDSTDRDVYCSVVGSDGNLGVSADTPKASLQSILNAYDLEAGDIVYVDTGTYDLNVNQTITAFDCGTNGNPVLIQGSTNGTVFNRNWLYSDGYVLEFSPDNGPVQDVTVSDIQMEDAYYGAYLNGARRIILERVCSDSMRSAGMMVHNSSNITFRSCLSRSGANGIRSSGSQYVHLENTVVWQQSNTALRVDSGWISATNCAFSAYGDNAYIYYAAGVTNIQGDYNALCVEDNAVVGYIALQSRKYDTLTDWSEATDTETHSLDGAPLFADADNGDFHLKTITPLGRRTPEGGFTSDLETSPLIDSGCPTWSFANEPEPNGGRVNIGLYGNSWQASIGRTNAWIYAASLREGGGIHGTSSLYWIKGNNATDDLVRIEYSWDGGDTWTVLTSDVPADVAEFAWDTTFTNDTPAGLWRVMSQNDTNLVSQTTNFFSLRNNPLNIYVNDLSTNLDVYTTAIGVSNNWRSAADCPQNSLITVLDRYDLEPGDTIWVDTGSYTNQRNIRLGRYQSGGATNPLLIIGSTGMLHSATVIDRNGTNRNVFAIQCDTASWIAVSNLTVLGASCGVSITNSSNIRLSICSQNNRTNGVEVLNANNVTLSRCIIEDNARCGVYNSGSSSVRIENSLIRSNGVAMTLASGSSSVRQNILQDSGNGRYIFDLPGGAGAVDSDYNDILAERQAAVARVEGAMYRSLAEWQLETGEDVHSLSHDPGFVNPGTNDFHLKSEMGHYSAAGIVTDSVTSALIDTGDPSDSYSGEPLPNGQRINIGLYGDNGEASRSRTNGWLLSLTLNSGGYIRGTNYIYWAVGGVATDHMVYVDFSADGGVTWTNIGTNLLASDERFLWNTTNQPPTALGVWRVVSQVDTGIIGETETYFAIKNEPLGYYVNDASTNNDVYCTEPGNAANNGLRPSTPKDSVQDLIDTYTLTPGDRVLIDTGTYTLTNTLTINDLEGSGTNLIYFTGSTNYRAQGSQFILQEGSAAIKANNSSKLKFESLFITNAPVGIHLFASSDCSFSRVITERCGDGFVFEGASSNDFVNCGALAFVTNGLRSMMDEEGGVPSANAWDSGVLSSAAWSSNTTVLTTGCCVRVEEGVIAVSNTILYASGKLDYALSLGPAGAISADYNNYYLTNADYIVVREQEEPSVPEHRYYVNLEEWSDYSGCDLHSLSVEPGVEDISTNWHLVSQGGRYDQGTGLFVVDGASSRLLDAGDPAASYTNETLPNGARRNIGLYGNTTEASQTPTNSFYSVITVNDGGQVSGTNYLLQWVAHGNATGHTITIEYSWDAGLSWTTVVSGVAANLQSYQWDTTLFSNSLFGFWRLGSDQELYDTTTNRMRFALRNAPMYFYVNDPFTNNDVYCNAGGSDTNNGLSPESPVGSIQQIVDAYDLEGGDVVYIDTGTYTDAVEYVVDQWDSGSSSNRVLFCGSTNVAAGGSLLDGIMFTLRNTLGIELRDLVIEPNGRYGIQSDESINLTFDGVQVYEAEDGFHLTRSANTLLRRCVATGCESNGLYCQNSTNMEWSSGVMWSNNVGIDAVSGLSGTKTSIRVYDSIFGAGSGAKVYELGGVDLIADYNNYYLINGAEMATESAKPFPDRYATVSRWVRDTGRDQHSLSRNPYFVSPAIRNYQLCSKGGRRDIFSGSIVTDAVSSCLIDAGNPATDYSNEPDPNGRRLNVGLYGDSLYAAMTATNGSLTVVTLNDGGLAQGTNTMLYWLAHGCATGHAVKLEYSSDDGSSWQEIAGSVPPGTNEYIWDTTAFTSSVKALWRVTSLADSSIIDESDTVFALRNAPIYFYVNDSSLIGDVYTAAIGASTNSGLSPAQPMASIAAVVGTYDLESQDVLFIDTGNYDITDDIVFGQLDSAQQTNLPPLYVLGSTDEIYGGTSLDCNGKNYGIYLYRAIGIAFENLEIHDSLLANLAIETCFDIAVTNIESRASENGVWVDDSENISFRHCAIHQADQAGLYGNGNINISFESGVLWSNVSAGVRLNGGELFFSNNIVSVYDENAYAYSLSAARLYADYNCIFLTNGAMAAYDFVLPIPAIYNNLSLWVRAETQDVHSLSSDPLFVEPASGDFHLKSQRGHYDVSSGTYINDPETSPLIDAGISTADYSLEPTPNGGRVNIGRYANTIQASKSPTNAAFNVISLNDGGRTEGQALLYWLAYGDATGHTVRLEFSSDAGSTWQLIVAGIPASQSESVWSTILYDSTMLGCWRVVSEDDPSVYAQNRDFFAVRNEPLAFYVNDDSLVGDMYCSEVGYSTNYGVEPVAPKESLKEILDQWDVEPGDAIYVDTGHYLISETITINSLDSGVATNDSGMHVTLAGSTNDATGGTIFDFYTGQDGLSLYQANGVDIRNLNIRYAGTGLRANLSHFSSIDFVRVEKCTTGFDVSACDPFNIVHSIAANCTYRGINCDNKDNYVVWENGVLWSNRYGIYKGGGSLTVLNSAIASFGSDQYAYYVYDRFSALTSDFNSIYLASDAYCAAVKSFATETAWTTRYETVAYWQGGTVYDTHTLPVDPSFNEPYSGDFHLKSSIGRYDPDMGWTNDMPFVGSRLIDSGKTGMTYDEEPSPNGGRINIGCYGNSSQASMTPTQGWVSLIFPKTHFDIEGTVDVRWVTGWIATGHTMRLDYSADDGFTWSNIVTALPPAWNGHYRWNVETNSTRSALGRVKVSSEVNPLIFDISERGNFRPEGTIPYYVNDDSTNGDVYCSAAGNDNNDGLTTNTPKRTIQAILDEYRLAPVDILYVDSGDYTLHRTLTITDADSGQGTNHVIIQGSTNAVVPTILNRNGANSPVITLSGARGIELRDLVLKNGREGVAFGGAVDCDVIRVESSDQSGAGFSLSANSSSIRFINCLAWNNAGSGVDAEQSTFAMENSICWNNNHAVSFAVGASATFTNCVLQAAGSGKRVFFLEDAETGTDAPKGDYNNFYLADGSLFAEKVNVVGGNDYFGYLLDWQEGTTQELFSFSIDPLFVQPDNGDFHLKSVEGRYVPGIGWTNDTENSPLLDVGYPGSIYTNEPSPNGERINVGAYGNTGQASMSQTNPWLRVITLSGGGVVRNSIDLKWTSGLFSNDSMVRLEYTPNGGVTWPVITSNVNNDVSSYAWDVVDLPLSAQTKWRIVWQDNTNVLDESDFFAIKPYSLNIYVNDDSTNGDIYTTAVGSDFNSGTNPAVPFASPYTAFNRYPLGEGDTIWIDTGYYELTNDQYLALGANNRGSVSDPLCIWGSGQMQYGGSVIDVGGGSNSVLDIRNTRYIYVSNLVLCGSSDYGVRVSKVVECGFRSLNISSNEGGMYISISKPVDVDRCTISRNRGYGLFSSLSSVTFDHGVIADNDYHCFGLSSSSFVLSNSIVHTDGSGDAYVFRESESSYAGDYNFIYVPTGRPLGYLVDSRDYYYYMVQWQKEHGGADQFSVRADPAFVDPLSRDYRLMSQEGHFTYSGYIADTGTSWAIDAGRPGASYVKEPTPNGGRLNSGLYGNTEEASKSYTNEPALQVVSFNDGGTLEEPPTLYWLSRGLSPTNLITIEYSYDNGVNWLYVTGGVSVAQNGYYWVDTNAPSPEAYWRITLENDSSVFDTNDVKFTKRTGPITYYVNDNSLVGDIYTTAVGDPDNTGYSSNSPKDSIWGILGNPNYELAGNDRILVDTGHYHETNQIVVVSFNSGVSTASVEIIGSTNVQYDGAVLDWSNAVTYGLVIGEDVSYVDFKNLTLQHADGAIRLMERSSSCVFSNVLIRDCLGSGMKVDSSGHDFIHSVITRCTDSGIYIVAPGSINLRNSIIWSNMGSALLIDQDGRATVTNSVIHACFPETYCYEMKENASLNADYNNIYVGSNGYYALHNDVLLVEGLPQWTLLTTQDVHSLSADPLFNDTTDDDYHLASSAGRFDPVSGGYVTSDIEFSHLIDTGSTNAAYEAEPVPNGSRVNIGLYGNTDQASKSDTNAWIYAITASAGGQLHGLFNLVWAYGGIDPTNAVKLEYSYDNGVNWTNIKTTTIGDGQYLWMSDILDYSNFRWYPSPIARWRISLVSDTNISDMTDNYFALRNIPFVYYLNDTSLVNDIYTTAVGNDTNWGFFPWAPKATLVSLLDGADLGGEDRVLFDSGNYLIGTNQFAIVGRSDEGLPGDPVTIQGNTNQLLSCVINTSGVNEVMLRIDANYIHLTDLGFENGSVLFDKDGAGLADLSITNGSLTVNGIGQVLHNVSIVDGDTRLNAGDASVDTLAVHNGQVFLTGTNISLAHALVIAQDGPAISTAGINVDVGNSTIVSEETAVRVSGEANTLHDSIVVGSGSGHFCFQIFGGGSLVSDRNNLLARDGAWIGNRDGNWEKLLYWQRASGMDENSISTEPLFVDEAGDDYHLKSLTGHWTVGGWVADAQHSPCIDYGPVLSSATNEPEPNGGRVNMGAYGDSDQASKSLTNAWLLAVTMNDGGVLRGTNTLHWRAGNLGATDLVRIEYSANGGVTWVTNATGISAASEQYAWDTTQNASSFNALWRVVLITNTLVLDECDSGFAVRNTNVIFYVNDGSLSGDVYCGAVGSPANDGLTTNTPKDSIQHVLDSYDTEGGDRIRVDTGSYSLTQDVQVIWSRGGDAEYGDMVIQGSTNFAVGGSRVYRGGLSAGLDAFNIPASHVSVADLGIFNSYRGVYFWSNITCSADGLLLSSNVFGVYAEGTMSVTTRHSRIVDNSVGVYWLRTLTADVVNCTFVNNTNVDVYLDGSAQDVMYNNIYYRSISNDVYGGSQGVIDNAFIDYNIYYLLHTNALWGGYTDLMGWQLQRLHDFRSAFTNPLMVDVVNGDYHVQSTAGRYVDGLGWIPAVLDGWGIDKGSPGSDYSMEPSVNGDRINIGAYGGTIYASKGYTNTVVHTRTLNQETHIDYTNSLWPLIWTVQDVPTDVTFSVEYSGDNGASWYVLTNGISPYQEYHIWQTTPFFNTYAGLWRVISSDGSYSDTNDAPFDIFYGDYEITHEGLNGDLNYIVWVGAWSENYRVQYSDAWMASSNGINWYNAPTGAGPNQTPWFDAPNGGDLTYEDIESTNMPYRLYRVIWDDAL